LNLGVPIGALDEPHHDARVDGLRGRDDPVDDLGRALLVSLDRQPEAVPAAQARVGERGADQLERQLQPIRFLGVHREVQVVGLRLTGERDEARGQLGHDALPRQRLVARVQCRELDRNPRPVAERAARAGADRRDRVRVSLEVALRIRRRARAFAQHVEGIAELRPRGGPRQCIFDGLTEHEVRPEEPHRLAHGRAHGRQAQASGEIVENPFRGFARMDDARADPERPRRGGDQKRVGFHLVVRPVPGRELVLDETIGGGGVRHPQQRLCEYHQGEALAGRERIFVQEILDAAEAAGAGADRLHQLRGTRIDPRFNGGAEGGLWQEFGRALLVARRVGCRKGRHGGCFLGRAPQRVCGHGKPPARSLTPMRRRESASATQSHYQDRMAGSPAGLFRELLRQPAAQEFAIKAPAL